MAAVRRVCIDMFRCERKEKENGHTQGIDGDTLP